ncbi:MAG TPA: hypothetical protein DCY40_00585, partial [Actinobacteria bacterium]|nr:hypothetical protein [Actinomycetota bacterium]
MARTPAPLFQAAIVRNAIRRAFFKLDPRIMVRNPVMFVVEVGAVMTTALWVRDLGGAESGFGGQIVLW